MDLEVLFCLLVSMLLEFLSVGLEIGCIGRALPFQQQFRRFPRETTGGNIEDSGNQWVMSSMY